MSKFPILDPDKSYTFRSYFEMAYERSDILAELGYSFGRRIVNLPQFDGTLDRLENLKYRIAESLPYVSLTSEAARRSLLIAPILLDVLHYTQAQLRIEYPLKVNDLLKGDLDYYMYTRSKILVVAAKNADISRGFTQLAVELIAMDIWTDDDEPILTGAVSTGDIWQFGLCDRAQKQITQDLNLYRVPSDLEPLLRIIVAVLRS